AQALLYRASRSRGNRPRVEAEHPGQTSPIIRHTAFDTDPHSDWVAPNETLYNSTTASAQQATNNRLEGLAPVEEFTTVTMRVPDGPIDLDRGESIRQAAIKSRNSAKSRRRAAQLLPHRWDRLSQFDLVHLWRWISANPSSPVATVLLL